MKVLIACEYSGVVRSAFAAMAAQWGLPQEFQLEAA